MSLFPCSVHGAQVPGKIATVFARWHELDGEFVGWKLRICASCLTSLMASLAGHLSTESSTLVRCPACGADSSEDLHPIYLFVFPPKQSSREYALTMCGSCATSAQGSFAGFGEKLPDRQVEVGASAPTLDFQWDSILP